MNTSVSVKTLLAGAVWSASALLSHAADNEMLLPDSRPDMLWTDASLWTTGGVPSEDSATVLVNIGDADNSLLINSAATVGNLQVEGNSSVILDAATFKTTLTGPTPNFGDVLLYGNSAFRLQNGAVLDLAQGMSLKTFNNSSFEVDASTFNGKFDTQASNVLFRNGSTWNATGISLASGVCDIVIDDSAVNLLAAFKMGAGSTAEKSKKFVLKGASTMGGSGGKSGINFAGEVGILEGSAISNVDHFNIGAESGAASGINYVTVRGSSDAVRSSVTADNFWLNTNAGGDSKLVLDGFATISAGKFDINNSNGGDFNVVFQNSGNIANIGNNSIFGTKGGGAMSGSWKISTAQGAENNAMTFSNQLVFAGSEADGNSVSVGVDWGGGETNEFKAGNIFMNVGTAANSTAQTYMTVRDGAKMELGNVNVGNDTGTAKSGTSSLNVLDGGALKVGAVNLNQSDVAGATSVAKLVVSNSTLDQLGGDIRIGGVNANMRAVSGSSVMELSNKASVDMGARGLRLLLSTEAGSTAESRLVVDGSTLVTSGEIFMLHSSAGIPSATP